MFMKRACLTKKISRQEELRGSDEVIVSDDPAGQHNPQESQGPLDGIVATRNLRWNVQTGL